jgi:GNAT superfamily N-acetyltransferase
MLDMATWAKAPGAPAPLSVASIVTLSLVVACALGVALLMRAPKAPKADQEKAKGHRAAEARREAKRAAPPKRESRAPSADVVYMQAVPKVWLPKVYLAKYTAEIYASASSWEILGELQEGDQVLSTGPPESCDGFWMVPIEPRGVVDASALEVPGSEASTTASSAGSEAGSPSARAADRFVENVVALGDHELSAQVRSLSMEAFEEDAMQPAKGEKVSALLRGDEVVAYASYTVRPSLGSLNVNKLAVSSSRRRQGLGRVLVRQLVQLTRRGGAPPGSKASGGGKAAPLEVVCLSALPTAIAFYKACGFKAEEAVRLSADPADAEDFIEGQVYMEYRLRRSRR